MDTHMEVIPWMRPGYPPQGNVTVVRQGSREQEGAIISGKWMSGEALTVTEIGELNIWASRHWDMPFSK